MTESKRLASEILSKFSAARAENSNPQPHRWLPLLRSRWHFEVNKLRLGNVPLSTELEKAGLFAYQPVADELALGVAEDLGDTYRFLGPLDLQQAGQTLEQALQRAFKNLPPPGGLGNGPPFEEVPGLGWAPRGGRHEHAAIHLVDTAAIRKLPVRGRHIAFAPHTHLLVISGSYDHASVQKLTQLAMQEFATPQGKPLAPGPLILEEDGCWRPWHPAPEHPSHWSVKRLHTLGNEQLYRLQKQMLDELQADKTDRPFVGSHRALEGENGRLYSYCVFTVTSLLPRTEYVMLRPIVNEAEIAANPKAEPQFGPPLILTWESFAAFQGANLKAEGMYPERYYIDQFPDDMEWKKLQPEQQKVAPEFMNMVLSDKPAAGAALAPLRPPVPPASPPAKRDNRQLARLIIAFAAGLVAFPLLLLMTVVVIGIFFWWSASRAASYAQRAGHPPPAVSQQGFGFSTQTFAAYDEWHSMDESLPLPALEGAKGKSPAKDAKPGAEPVELVSSGPSGENVFFDQSPGKEPLVGMRIIRGKSWGGAVQALQPIYQGTDGYFLGTWCGEPGGDQQAQTIAKPGYAVGAIEVHRGLVVNAIRIEYWRIADGKLDPDDKYATDWYGCPGGGKLPTLSSEGKPVVGIAGHSRGDLIGLQLIRTKE